MRVCRRQCLFSAAHGLHDRDLVAFAVLSGQLGQPHPFIRRARTVRPGKTSQQFHRRNSIGRCHVITSYFTALGAFVVGALTQICDGILTVCAHF